MSRLDASPFNPQVFRLNQASAADAVFYVAIQRDEAAEAGRMQEAARWQAVLRAIDELEHAKPEPGTAVH